MSTRRSNRKRPRTTSTSPSTDNNTIHEAPEPDTTQSEKVILSSDENGDDKDGGGSLKGSGNSEVEKGHGNDATQEAPDATQTTHVSNPYFANASQEEDTHEMASCGNVEEDMTFGESQETPRDNPFAPSGAVHSDPTKNNVLEAMLTFVLEDNKKKAKPNSSKEFSKTSEQRSSKRKPDDSKNKIPRFLGGLPSSDWTIKDRAVFISSQSFEWISLQSLTDEYDEPSNPSFEGGSYDEDIENDDLSRVVPFSALDEVSLLGNCHSHIKDLAKSFQYRWDYRQFTPQNTAIWRTSEESGRGSEKCLQTEEFKNFMGSVISTLKSPEMAPGPCIFRMVHFILRRAFNDARKYFCFPSSDFAPEMYTGLVAASRRLVKSQVLNDNDKANGEKFLTVLSRWHQSLRSAASQVLNGSSLYTMIKYENRNMVMFRKADSHVQSAPIAIISRSTTVLRNTLRKLGIPFSMPLAKSYVHDSEAIPEELQRELNKYRDSTGARVAYRGKANQNLTTEQSLLLIRGEVSCRRLVAYLCADLSAGLLGNAGKDDARVTSQLETEFVSLGLTSSSGRIPKIYSLKTFSNATQEYIHISKNGKLPKAVQGATSYDMYRLEISGPILPGIPQKLVRILGHVQLLLHAHTLAMRLVVSKPVRHKFAESARHCVNEKSGSAHQLEQSDFSDVNPQCRESYAADFTAQMFDCSHELSLDAEPNHISAESVKIGYCDRMANKEDRNLPESKQGSQGEDEHIDEESYHEAKNAILQCTFWNNKLCSHFNSNLVHKAITKKPVICTEELEKAANIQSRDPHDFVSLRSKYIIDDQKQAYKLPKMVVITEDGQSIEDRDEDCLLTIKERVPDAFSCVSSPLTLASVRCVCVDLWNSSLKPIVAQVSKLRNTLYSPSKARSGSNVMSQANIWPWSGSDDLDDYYSHRWYSHCVLPSSKFSEEGDIENVPHAQWTALVGQHGGASCSIGTPIDNSGTPLQWTPCFLAARAAAVKTLSRCGLAADVNTRPKMEYH